MKINQIKAGAFLSYISITLNNLIGLLYTPFMLRMLGQNEYGLFSLVSSVVAYLTILDLGFGNAIVRYTAKFRAENKINEQYELFGMFLILYSIIGIVTLIIGLFCIFYSDALFSETIKGDDLSNLRIMLFLMVANVAITFPFSIWSSVIVAYERFVFQKMVNIVRIVLNPVVMILLLAMGYKAVAMVVVITIFNIVTLLLNTWYCFSRLKIKVRLGKFKIDFIKEVSLYSFWIFLNSIVDKIYWSTGQFILGVYKGPISVAIYAIAIQLEHVYLSFSTAISGVLLPKVTSIVVKGNSNKNLTDVFIRAGRIQYHILLFILIGFSIFGYDFIILWAGENYKNAYYIALIFFVPLIIPLSQNVGITILQAKNRMKFRSLLYVVIAVLSVLISIPLSIRYDGIGCAIGTATALIAGQIVAMNIYYYRVIKIDIPLFWREIFKCSIFPLAYGLVVSLILRFFHFNYSSVLSFMIQILLFSLTYIVIAWKFSLSESERLLFKKPVVALIKKQ